MSNSFPVYQIDQFRSANYNNDFYTSRFNKHVKEHEFAGLPHKHDFYLVVLITKGSGVHQIDFENHEVKPGCLFFMKPGQMHSWELSKDIDGFVFFHSRDFYDKYFVASSITNFHFFKSYQRKPFMIVDENVNGLMLPLFESLILEFKDDKFMKWQKVHTLIHLIYIEMARGYIGSPQGVTETYMRKLNDFEEAVELNFKRTKYPKDYAEMLNISEKHLNRISKSCLNKTCTTLIAERVILEAKRILSHSELSINQIADELGFNEKSYFNRFFKKYTKMTPLEFKNKFE